MLAIEVPARRGLALEGGVVVALWRREMLRYSRDGSQLFGGVSRTILWLLILGFGLGAALREIEGYTYAQYVLPGVVVLNILFASMYCAFAVVRDRESGFFRVITASPASRVSIVLGKLLGGGCIATLQGAIPLLFLPVVQMPVTAIGIVASLLVMFVLGMTLTAFGIVIALRIRSLESFGAVSNGIVQPLYFLSGSIFPLKGVIGGVGFLDLAPTLREELRRLGINTLGGAWVVELPTWLWALVSVNPVSYGLDLLRYALMGYHQLPLATSLAVLALLPPIAAAWAVFALHRAGSRDAP